MNSTVAAIPCDDYTPADVLDAVRAAWRAASGPSLEGKTVLLKPNMVFAAEPDRAVSTHPEILRAAIRTCREAGAARVVVGESPGYQGFEAAARACGLMEVIRAEGAEWDDFSRTAELKPPERHADGCLVKSFTVAAAAVEADYIVSLPKLKTHGLMQYSGAIKNLFGCVPGLEKAAYHLRFPQKERFGRMIVDLALSLDADFAIMDAVTGMEGPGPGNGYPRQVGLVLASANLLALDRTACRVIGQDPDLVGYLTDARARGAWLAGAEDASPVDARGRPLDPGSRRVEGYLLMPDVDAVGFQRILPPILRSLAKKLLVKKPVFQPSRCTRCGGCIKICPAKALEFQHWEGDRKYGGRRVVADYRKCIRCYCCHEICPADAIDLRRF